MLDPTRTELIEFLESKYADVTCGESLHTVEWSRTDAHDGCGCRFDIEAAAWYLASQYHGGQWSNLYSALSVSSYNPGPMSKGLNEFDEPTACALFDAGADWIEDGTPTNC